MDPTDALFTSQWYLTGPNGINILPVWDDYTGTGVRVAVFDQGIDGSHEDLDGNFSAALSVDASDLSSGGTPQTSDDNHGTAVAGIIAAERNGIGIVGIAYDATLIGIYSPLAIGSLPNEAANAFHHAADHADVLNNSWGYGNLFFDDQNSAFIDNFKSSGFSAARLAVEDAGLNGLGGLGTIVVQSAGNARAYGDDTNLHSFGNNRFTVTVAATLENGAIAPYSTPGASVLVAAPGSAASGSIVTTDRTGAPGYSSGGYATDFNGTSAAAPMVSGIVALMLEANPDLGIVDIQQILALSARQTGSAATYAVNGATNWNGGGLHTSRDFGFGLVDATAAVRLAESWQEQKTYSTAATLSQSFTVNQAIPDGTGSTSYGFSLAGSASYAIHRVEIDLRITHGWIGDLVVTLTSPSGTASILLNRPGVGDLEENGSDQDNVNFVFGSVQFLGETAGGTWTIGVRDLASGDSGTFNGFTTTVYGELKDADDTYVYTNEFSALGIGARAALADANGGIDWLNASAVTGNSIIDLTPGGASSLIAGKTLSIAAGTLIENAWAGDGNDLLTGNGAANRLEGGRGADNLAGGGGADTLAGGAGNDVLDGGFGLDVLAGGLGDDIYYVDGAGDIVTDLADQGTDRIAVRSGSFALAAGAEIEFLNTSSIHATKAIDLTGNALSQRIVGNDGANRLHDGGVGAADTLIGGLGNDSYSVYNAGDVIIELAGEGVDRVSAGVSYVLAANVEIELFNTTSLHATYAVDLTGNGFAQTVRGNDGQNRIDGGGGSDTLFGEDGADTFVFSTALGPDNTDTIADFSIVDDAVTLLAGIFSGLSLGALAAQAFKDIIDGPKDADDHIIYNSGTGNLYYDGDGSGGAFGNVRFATVLGTPALTAADFVVV